MTPSYVLGQSRPILDCEDECPQLELEHVVRLGSLDEGPSLSPFSVVVQQSDGKYLVGPTFEEGTFAVFGPDGKYIKSVGRYGQGPGEMRGVLSVSLWRDSVFVATRGFMHVFSPRHEYVRRFPFSILQRKGYAIADEGLFVNRIGSRNPGQNIHRLDHEGRATGEGWSTSPSRRIPGGDYSDVGLIATNGPDVLFAPMPSYEIARLSGSRLERFERDLPWFEPWHDDDDGRTASEDVLARLNTLGYTSNGLVVATVVRQDRRRPRNPDPTFDSSRGLHELWDSHIELIDLDRRRVVASVLRPELFRGTAAPDLLFSIRAEHSGLVVADLWRIRLPATESEIRR